MNSHFYPRPIYEPTGSPFRPWSLATLMGFFIGRLFGRMFRNRRKDYVVKEGRP